MSRRLVIVLLLLLLFLALRVNNVLSFPGFIDESEHIRWARDVYDLHPFSGAHSGRLFGLWWMAGFGLQHDTALFLARVATTSFNLLTATVLFDLGRRLLDARTGTLAVLFYALSPYAFFYERMGLTDTYVTVWAALATWLALRYSRRLSLLDAVGCGIALTAAFTAKATGLTMAAIPGLLLLVATPRLSWKQRVQGIAISYAVFTVGTAAFYGFLKWRSYSYLSAASTIVGTRETTNVLDRLTTGLEAVWKLDIYYFSLPLLLLAAALAVVLLIRQPGLALFLIGATLIPLAGLLAFALKYSARYFHFHMPFLLLLVAIGLGQLARDLSRRSPVAGWAVLVLPLALWSILFALPFQVTYFDDPESLDLPPLDRLEYITSDAAGFMLPDVAEVVQTQGGSSPVVVVGLLSNCGVLDFYLPDSDAIRLICPVLRWDGSHQAEVAALVNRLAVEHDALWVIFGASPFVSLDGITAPLVLQATFERPGGLTRIDILRAIPS